jgi:integrase
MVFLEADQELLGTSVEHTSAQHYAAQICPRRRTRRHGTRPPRSRASVPVLAEGEETNSVGLRIGEALALQVGDITVETRRARVERTWTKDGGKDILGTPKSGKPRTVPLHEFLLDELLPLLEEQPAVAFVFRAVGAVTCSPDNWRERVWRRTVAGTRWEGLLTPHDMRHTAASMAIASGADVKVVQVMLGHASALETLDRYGHLWPDRLDEVTAAVGAARKKNLRPDQSGHFVVILNRSWLRPDREVFTLRYPASRQLICRADKI